MIEISLIYYPFFKLEKNTLDLSAKIESDIISQINSVSLQCSQSPGLPLSSHPVLWSGLVRSLYPGPPSLSPIPRPKSGFISSILHRVLLSMPAPSLPLQHPALYTLSWCVFQSVKRLPISFSTPCLSPVTSTMHWLCLMRLTNLDSPEPFPAVQVGTVLYSLDQAVQCPLYPNLISLYPTSRPLPHCRFCVPAQSSEYHQVQPA